MIEADGLRGRSTAGAAPLRSGRDRWSDLAPRLASALVMVALALGTATAGGPVFAAFWFAASAAILWEWQRLVGPDTEVRCSVAGALCLAAAVLLAGSGQGVGAGLAVGIGLLGVAGLARSGVRTTAAAGFAYAAAPAVAVVVLRGSGPDGFRAILWLFAVVWGTDVMAYFGGRLLAGPKLWPRVSPGKTWSGFLVGVGCGALAGLVVRPPGTPALPCFCIGLLAGLLAQAGDLFESGLKRRYGVKDAGFLIPGHGGVMDRLDGFVAAAVFAACLGATRFGFDGAATGLFVW